MPKLKVFYTGGEGVNWALDHDLVHLCRIMGCEVQVVDSVDQADLIHSVFWRGLINIPYEDLIGKRVVVSIADNPKITMGMPDFLRVREKVTFFMSEYMESQRYLTACGVPVLLFPDPIDLVQFSARENRAELQKSFRKEHQIDEDVYLMGNFFRDSSMSDLSVPKKQKGADFFYAVIRELAKKNIKLHLVLAGPRRHWLINKLKEENIPYTYLGEETGKDDVGINTLNLDQVSELYQILDLYFIPSRWEGAPNAVLEAAASKTKVVSTRVGQSPDILHPDQIVDDVSAAVSIIERDVEENVLSEYVESAYQRVQYWNCDQAIRERLLHIYNTASQVPAIGMKRTRVLPMSQPERYARKVIRKARWAISNPRKEFSKLTVALWHDFQPPPYGGGNQFMLALEAELQKRGIKTTRNDGFGADLHILQAIWFDYKKLLREKSPGSFVLHRIDGPIQLYRGDEFSCDDDLCYKINAEIADATIMQTAWSYEQTRTLGYHPRRPVIVKNAVDPSLFHKNGKKPFDRTRKTKIISTSWSDNPRKGKATYQWLDKNLDFSKYEYTFVGRIQDEFENINVHPPVSSEELVQLMWEHDVYITASQRDPCSNALTEALSCGLPAVFFKDGGHPEIVEFGGLPFEQKEEIPQALDRIVEHYDGYQSLIWVNNIKEVIDLYLETYRAALLIS